MAWAVIGLCGRSCAAERLLLADGTAVEANLAEAGDDGKLAFDADGKRWTPAGKDLVRWGRFAPVGNARLAVLAGGDLVVCRASKLRSDMLELATAQFGELRVPRTAALGLIVKPPVDSTDADRLIESITRHAPAESPEKAGTLDRVTFDRVTLDNGDVVEGNVTALDEAKLTLRTDARAIDLDIERVRSLAFAGEGKRDKRHAELRYVVGTSDGSRITASSIALADAGLEAIPAWNAKLTIASEHVAAIQTLGGRAVYLSDMQAAGYKHVPYLATAWPLAVDRSVGGGRLRADGRAYLKGLGMHSAASATYLLDKPYRRFEAELAIDDSVYDADASATRQRPARGSVVFRIYADSGDGQWKLRHASETIRGGDAPTPVSVDVRGAKRLSLIVDFADRADEYDRAAWLDARWVE